MCSPRGNADWDDEERDDEQVFLVLVRELEVELLLHEMEQKLALARQRQERRVLRRGARDRVVLAIERLIGVLNDRIRGERSLQACRLRPLLEP